MKRKILSSLVLLVVVFQVFSISIFAAGTFGDADQASSDVLLDEIALNMVDSSTGKTTFDISKYPKSENGSPLIIGGYESGIFDNSDPALFVYIYNPSEKELEKIKASFRVSLLVDSVTVFKSNLSEQIELDLVRASTGGCQNRFYKAKIDLSSYDSKYNLEECTGHVFTLETTIFYYRSASRPTTLFNEIAFNIEIDKAKDALNCSVLNKEVEELEIGMTCYRHGSSNADFYTVNQINSAYFSVPDRYAEYFESIYSIASKYKKKTTVPIMWGEFPSNYKDYVFLSQNKDQFVTNPGESYPCYAISSETGVAKDLNIFDSGYGLTYSYTYAIENLYSFDELIKFSNTNVDANDDVPRNVLYEYFERCQNDGSNKILFVDSNSCYTTRTIDQSFDSLTYDTQVSFWQRVQDYDFWTALKNHWASGKISVDQDKYDIPYIVLCDDSVKADLANLSKTDFCAKYFIDFGDYDSFKSYLKTHKNVYLYRFDISEHWSDVLEGGTVSIANFSKKLDSTFGICQTSYYDDFQVVNLTFKDEFSYLSVAVTSDPQDFIGSAEYVPGDPDNNEGEDWWKELMKKLEEIWAAIKRFMIIIAIIVVVILVVTVIGHFTGFLSNVSNIFKNNRKNE